MADRLLLVETTSSDEIPARIIRMLTQRRTQIVSLHMARRHNGGAWFIQLVVDVTGENEIELLVKRLNRLVDVISVVDADGVPTPHHTSASLKRLVRLKA